MSKYLINMPTELKVKLTNMARKRGFTLNGFILEILWAYVEGKDLDSN